MLAVRIFLLGRWREVRACDTANVNEALVMGWVWIFWAFV